MIMNLKKVGNFFSEKKLWEKPFSQWKRDEILQLGEVFFEAVFPEHCRYEPKLFTKLIDEGVLPDENSGCPLVRICQKNKKKEG